MNRRTAAMLLLLLVLAMASNSLGQKQEKVGDKLNRVADSLKVKEPNWKLSWNRPGDKNTKARWVSGEDDVIVLIVDYETEAQAYGAFRFNQSQMTNGPLPKEVKNFADQALLWDDGPHRTASMHFRKGTLVVMVNTTTASIAKHFASEVLKQL